MTEFELAVATCKIYLDIGALDQDTLNTIATKHNVNASELVKALGWEGGQ